jgi:hypothetical protein
VRWVSGKKKKSNCQLFNFNPVYQLMSFDGGVSPLTFSVNIERYVFSNTTPRNIPKGM